MPDIDLLIALENGELDHDETVAFIQDGINRGGVWSLQGSYGRLANRLIEAGECTTAQ